MNFRYLTGPDDPALADVFRIYHASFPPESREPDERLIQELRGEYRLPFKFLITSGAPSPSSGCIVPDEGEGVGGEGAKPAEDRASAERSPAAFARFAVLYSAEFAFLIHIAVDEPWRGQGIGTALLQRVLQDASPLPLLVEIDREGPVLEWYERQGFHVVSETYTQPAVRPETGPVRFALFAHGHIPDRSEMVVRFYQSVWELKPDHPFVREALGA
ncbi:GNAT family N-acetyltransferase [Fimbriimonas ginsengisoli]|uniref:Acetyltransferase, GNAT family n=1 Tax=Fimbriimonas ginsengisoli Gsoil 348 TaxID=661478 RepID=A0A068NUJ8_FIMGI|nr:GNAT family N-acetyltransferase [Fimbriimonas ginsengisoli]AIE87096.1 acetyltransferase, GNAT family [Fimbriimonas ginsengisoli Gsoil 348]